jgi:glutamate-1-semialdehyde 2,1-aminomutase
MTDTQYVNSTPTSRTLFDRARNVLPGGVSYGIRDLVPYPFYVARAAGSRLWDIDGNEYADYWCGHGAMILGHAPRQVIEATCRQISLGSHFGFAHPLEVELAEVVTRLVPSAEMIRYTNSGTEANMYAVALARGFTGRTRIAKIEGGWHGGVECLNKAVKAPFDAPESSGLNPHSVDDTVIIPFNDLGAARTALEREDIASLHVEPVMGTAGCIPAEGGYLEGLRELTARHKTLLVFDEVITGFRIAPGGAQQHFGVTPDITILGKILGGGFPIGALCGRRNVFERLDHRLTGKDRRVFHGGTFSANPVSLTAGLETLRLLQEGPVYSDLDRLGARLRTGLETALNEGGIAASVTGLGSMVGVHFRPGPPPRNARESAEDDERLGRAYFEHMLNRRIVFLVPSLPHMFLTTKHTDADVDELVEATRQFARSARMV